MLRQEIQKLSRERKNPTVNRMEVTGITLDKELVIQKIRA